MSGNDQSELKSSEIRRGKRLRQRSSSVVGRCVRICEHDPYSPDNNREDIDHRSDLAYDHFQMQPLNKSDQRLTVRGNAQNLSSIHEENVERLSFENGKFYFTIVLPICNRYFLQQYPICLIRSSLIQD